MLQQKKTEKIDGIIFLFIFKKSLQKSKNVFQETAEKTLIFICYT